MVASITMRPPLNLKSMNREQRRNQRQAIKAATKENRKSEQSRQTLENIYEFITKFRDDPEAYVKCSNRIYLLRCMGVMLDSLVSDVDRFMDISDFDRGTHKIMKKVSEGLDQLLDRLQARSVDAFGKDCVANGQRNDQEYGDLCQVALTLQDFIELFVIYFVDPKDQWRLHELDKFMEKMVTPDAIKAKVDDAKAKIEHDFVPQIEKLKIVLNK